MSQINCTSLYDRAKMIFEAENGINEDGSDYGFDDYVREVNSLLHEVDESSESVYFGGELVNESGFTSDIFNKMHDEWIKKGRHIEDLDDDPFSPDENRKHFNSIMRKVYGDIGNGTKSSLGNHPHGGTSSAAPTKSSIGGNGRETFLQGAKKDILNGVNDYMNQFMPRSWIEGAERGISRGAKSLFHKVGGDKLAKGYNAVGGNKALALGALGGLTMGPVGALVGGLAGKGLQKLVNYGNRVK